MRWAWWGCPQATNGDALLYHRQDILACCSISCIVGALRILAWRTIECGNTERRNFGKSARPISLHKKNHLWSHSRALVLPSAASLEGNLQEYWDLESPSLMKVEEELRISHKASIRLCKHQFDHQVRLGPLPCGDYDVAGNKPRVTHNAVHNFGVSAGEAWLNVQASLKRPQVGIPSSLISWLNWASRSP